MIDFLGVKNFKSLHNIGIKLFPLNLFMGLNSMGKSSFMQILLLLRQSYYSNGNQLNTIDTTSQQAEQENNNLFKLSSLKLNGDLISLGNTKDVFYQNAGNEDILQIAINAMELSYAYAKSADSFYLNDDSMTSLINEPLYAMPLFSDSFYFLGAEHIGPAKTYSINNAYKKLNPIGNHGEFAPYFLARQAAQNNLVSKNLQHPKAKSSILAHQLDAWLSEITPGTKLLAEELNGLDLVKMNFQFKATESYSEPYAPINVGFGLPYVMPLILILLIAKEGDLVLIENPESHLHPRGQAKVGELIALAAQNGVQVLCETHSDHIINGIRVAVKEEKLSYDKTAFFYFDKNADSPLETKITPIQLDRNGELDTYPSGLLDEWGNLMAKLL